jgi:hypothetical protein
MVLVISYVESEVISMKTWIVNDEEQDEYLEEMERIATAFRYQGLTPNQAEKAARHLVENNTRGGDISQQEREDD